MNSICIATYNGEKFIGEQLRSIFPQLNQDDEIIIVDDSSSDCTIDIIKELNIQQMIRLYQNEKNLGVNASFEKAISLSNGDFIFLADQDDIWIEGRVQLMAEALKYGCLVSSNFNCFGYDGNPLKEYQNQIESKQSKYYFKNILDIFFGIPNYFGCAMAFRKELVPVILPFPSYLESHDLWIAMAANLMKSNIHIEDLTLHRRIHENNASMIKRNLYSKIRSRIIFGISIIVLLKRLIGKQETI